MRIEPLGQSSGRCDCCGNESQSVWGLVHDGGETVAAYWMHWTLGHLWDLGANLDLLIGRWGDADERVAVSLRHRESPTDGPEVMVIDAGARPIASSSLASAALARADVVGTPFAQTVFGLVDIIYEQDSRFF